MGIAGAAAAMRSWTPLTMTMATWLAAAVTVGQARVRAPTVLAVVGVVPPLTKVQAGTGHPSLGLSPVSPGLGLRPPLPVARLPAG